ncbi:MAG: phosphate propanoyltransferase [Nanoarchaeota archaeon]
MSKQIPVETSARHIHLSQIDFEKLYGKGKNLTSIKELSQPGEFASKETAIFFNGKNKIENVRIVGPIRKRSQAEISLTDAYKLKLNPLPQIRVSGDLDGVTKISVKNPLNSKTIKIPVIIAKRHLHCNEKQADELKLKNNQRISVKINGERETTFHNVIVRVSNSYYLSFHLDTDEANSAGIRGKTFGNIVK